MLEFIKIWLLCIGAAIAYGIVHDQFTARICVEYFTVYHPPVLQTTDPTLLALGWGVIATWWVGFLLGLPLALLSRVGKWPQQTAADLCKPLLMLTMTMATFALICGFLGYRNAVAHHQSDFECRLLTDKCAHLASYAIGELGGIVLCGMVLLKRWKAGKIAAKSISNLHFQ